MPPPWDEVVIWYHLGLKDREVDLVNNPKGPQYANGGEMMGKDDRKAFFAEKKREQEERQREAARQRARDELTGRSK